MAKGILSHLRRHRMQRWLRQEARLLARDAERFDCDAMRQEARRLLSTTESVGGIWVLRSA